MDKKYELVKDDYIIFNGHKLFRIRALKDFQTINGLTVKAGDLGGYIQSEKNLSQEGNCWVGNDAMVFDDARVLDNAYVFNNAWVCENTCVYDDACVYGDACVCSNAGVYGNAKVYNNACVYDDACVYGAAWVGDNAMVGNNADIRNATDYLYVKGFGTRFGTSDYRITFYKCKDNHIEVNCNFFTGTLDEFISRLKSTHKDNKFDKELLSLVEAVKIHFNL